LFIRVFFMTKKSLRTASSDPNKIALSERLRQIAASVGGVKRLIELSELPRSTFDNYLYARSEPPLALLVHIADAAGVSLEWLVSGRGEMRPRTGVDPSKFTLISHYDVQASAGHGALPMRENATGLLAMRRDWARRQFGLDSANLAVIAVTGDSMDPTIRRGDFLLIDTTVTDLRGEGVYVHRREDELRVKRFRPLPSGALVVDSDNPEYAVETYSAGFEHGIEIIGRVVMILRRV
jgi:phage repressor protein C with HTH and peptisase S24 domain